MVERPNTLSYRGHNGKQNRQAYASAMGGTALRKKKKSNGVAALEEAPALPGAVGSGPNTRLREDGNNVPPVRNQHAKGDEKDLGRR